MQSADDTSLVGIDMTECIPHKISEFSIVWLLHSRRESAVGPGFGKFPSLINVHLFMVKLRSEKAISGTS